MTTRSDRALTFIDNCTGSTDLSLLIEEFHEVIRAYGFTACACGAWTGIGKSRTYRFFFNSWPPDWIEHYNRENFFRDDPLVQESHRRMESFLWTDMQPIQLSPRAREIDAAVRLYGWKEVLGVPIHGPGDYQGFVAIATTNPINLQVRDRAFLEHVAYAIHNRCRKEIGFGVSPDLPRLTAREIECMKWVAVGKSDWEVGQVLGISASTVNFHVESTKKKLNKSTRTEAVAVLLLHGLL